MNILIVDDEPLQRQLLGGFLKKQGYSVVEAANGNEALTRFLHHPIDLVLLDHRMPDMNGDEVLARIKQHNPLARVIMITAYGAVDTAVRTMQLGAEDFLEKLLGSHCRPGYGSLSTAFPPPTSSRPWRKPSTPKPCRCG